MLKKFNLNKAYLCSALAVLLLIVSYQMAFRHTKEVWLLNRQLKADLLNTGDLQAQPGYLQRKNDNLNVLVSRFKADSLVFKSELVGTVAAIAEQNQAQIMSVPITDTTLKKEGLLMQKLELSGDFFSLLKVYDGLQSLPSNGLVRSVSFKTPVRPDLKVQPALIMEIYMTAIKQ